MKIYVIRHGETEMGKNRLIATEDELLNSNGIKQAKKIGKEIKKLNIDVAFVSPIKRAIDTLELLNLSKKTKVYIDNRLKERNMGVYEKSPFDHIDWNMFWNYNSDDKYSKLESMKMVYERVSNLLDEIKIKYRNKNILLVTHGGVSIAIYWYFYGVPKNGNFNDVTNNCEIKEYEL